MKILPLGSELIEYLKKRGLATKFEKQKNFFEENPFHPSLNIEILEPKNLEFYSFRIDRKYRAIFIYRGNGVVEIIDINNHYK
ncbi:MAG: hypothetical protein AAB556_01440 [Patescibacteria group bacterium]